MPRKASFTDALPRKGDEAVHIGQIADQSQRHPHRAAALAVDAQSEIIDRQAILVLWLAEARGQLRAGDSERDLAAPGVAEAAGAKRDVRRVGALLDDAMVDRAAVGIVEVDRDDATSPVRRRWPIPSHERPNAGFAAPKQLGEPP